MTLVHGHDPRCPKAVACSCGYEPLSFSRLREVNVRRCEAVFHPLKEWSACDWATALAGEVGEACNIIKKVRRLDGADKEFDNPSNRQELNYKLAFELADVVIYLDLLAAYHGIDLGKSVVAKFNQVSNKRGTHILL